VHLRSFWHHFHVHLTSQSTAVVCYYPQDMGAISSVNVLGNSIGVEQAQELIKNLQAKEKLTTLCGFSGDETELDLSNKNLSAGCAVLVANEISDIGALANLDIRSNRIPCEQKGGLKRICAAGGIELGI
jgi:hypothetical protein